MDLNNPMIFGALAPTTVQLLASAGETLTKEIEVQNQRFDAQLKAPQVGKLYADSLTRISRGDFEGFKGIAAATAMTAGNPILAGVFKDFDTAGVRLADSFMDRDAASARLQSSEAAMLERTKVSERGANNRFGLQIEREDNAQYQSSINDWERDKAFIDKNHQEEIERIRKANMGEARRAELEPGYQPKIQQAPKHPGYPKEPARQERIPMRSLLNLNDPDLPEKGVSGGIVNDDGLFRDSSKSSANNAVIEPNQTGGGDINEQAQPMNEQAQPLPPLVNENATEQVNPPQAEQAQEAEQRNEQQKPQDGKLERQIGSAVFEIHGYKPGAKPVDVSETVDTSTGKITISKKGEAPPANRLAESLAVIQANDPEFATWISKKLEVGVKELFIYHQAGDKEFQSTDTAYAINKDGSKEAFRHIADKDVVAAFKTSRTLMEGEMKGKFGLTFSVSEEKSNAARDNALNEVAEGVSTISEQNAILTRYRIEPINKEDVDIWKQKQRELRIRSDAEPKAPVTQEPEKRQGGNPRNIVPYIEKGVRGMGESVEGFLRRNMSGFKGG